MTDPIKEERRARRSREEIYRQMMNQTEEKPKASPSKGTLKGKSVRHIEASDAPAGKIFNRVTRKTK